MENLKQWCARTCVEQAHLPVLRTQTVSHVRVTAGQRGIAGGAPATDLVMIMEALITRV